MQLDFDIKKTVLASVNSWRSEILDNYNRSGMRASGKFEKELQVNDLGSDSAIHIQLLGASHSVFVERGRGKTRPNAPAGEPRLPEIIAEWARNKGIIVNAFAVAKKIHERGWVPQSLRKINKTVIYSVLNEKNVSKLRNEISKNVSNRIMKSIIIEFPPKYVKE